MNQESKSALPRCSPVAADPDAICDACGAFGAFALGDMKLCLDCYSEKGSCCPEFGKDDLWRERDPAGDNQSTVAREPAPRPTS